MTAISHLATLYLALVMHAKNGSIPRRILVGVIMSMFVVLPISAQTTSGSVTGRIYDATGAVVPNALIKLTNQGTGTVQKANSETSGIYFFPQVVPGTYSISVQKLTFATEVHSNVQLEVNQSITLDFSLAPALATATVTVTGEPPQLNTTSSTLGTVVNHEEVVGLPLNGRQFTQLVLLTPGAVAQEGPQQSTFTIALGAGGLSPSVNGQRGQQNNFTMDGTLNNSTYLNVWAISPPPDAIQEFNVQSHITDAQFAITTGANINVATRSGTNQFHGALWEFLRNDEFNAQTFPAASRLPYHHNQYGLYFGGPVTIPDMVDGKDNTWFSLYWEGYRFAQSGALQIGVPTTAMVGGDFSAELGAQVGTDDLGRPIYANEIYDPLTSRSDPVNPSKTVRDPFMYNGVLNVIPPNRLNPGSVALAKYYYPAPNMNVAATHLPNYAFSPKEGETTTDSDVFGIRFDHQFSPNDVAFLRFNRSNAHRIASGTVPSDPVSLSNYTQQAAFGYTHVIDPKTMLNFRYGYTYTNAYSGDALPSTALLTSLNLAEAIPPHHGMWFGPWVTVSNGFAAIRQDPLPLGPIEGMDWHLDATRIVGRHTLGAGVMYYHLRSYDDGWDTIAQFTQKATSLDGGTANGGFGAASFMLGALDTYSPQVGETSADETASWYGVYLQDQWQATPRLVVQAGFRWDYVTPPNYHKIVSGLNVTNGQFVISGAFPPAYPSATGPRGYFNHQFGGYEPRLGVTFRATQNMVIHSAFALLDDHNNTLVQEDQSMRTTYPSGVSTTVTSLDIGIPKMYIDSLPAASTYLSTIQPYSSAAANPLNKIPSSMEYNLGIQQQLSSSIALKIDYVGSVSRHLFVQPLGNMAEYPGPGAISLRQPYPQWGGPANFNMNAGNASYNALQAFVQKNLSAGLYLMASYTWSKSMDIESSGQSGDFVDFYNFHMDWGPSDFDRRQMLVLSGLYELPFGQGRRYLTTANRLVQAVASGWQIGTIVTFYSGAPFSVRAGSDVANVGDGAAVERAQRVAGVNPYAAHKTTSAWLNKAAFSVPTAYTYGNEHRNDLNGPDYRDVDAVVSRDFPLYKETHLQFRGEAFNVLNVTNYANPANTVTSAAFAEITGAAGSGRIMQLALKVVF